MGTARRPTNFKQSRDAVGDCVLYTQPTNGTNRMAVWRGKAFDQLSFGGIMRTDGGGWLHCLSAVNSRSVHTVQRGVQMTLYVGAESLNAQSQILSLHTELPKFQSIRPELLTTQTCLSGESACRL